jgi:hypothetical protein
MPTLRVPVFDGTIVIEGESHERVARSGRVRHEGIYPERRMS